MDLADTCQSNSAGQAAFEAFAHMDSISPLKKSVVTCMRDVPVQVQSYPGFRCIAQEAIPLHEEGEEIG